MPELYVIEPKKQHETVKKRVCAYARVSTDKESQANSYEVQVNYYRNKIKKNPEWILVDIYSEVKGQRLPWDSYRKAKYDTHTILLLEDLCTKYDVPFDLISKLMISVDNSKFFTRSSVSAKNVERILNEGWLHFEAIREGLKHED